MQYTYYVFVVVIVVASLLMEQNIQFHALLM